MGDWGLYRALMGGNQKGYWQQKRQDRMQSVMLMEKQAALAEKNLQTQMKFEESMQDAFVPRMDLISAVKTMPELAEALKSLSEDVDANT